MRGDGDLFPPVECCFVCGNETGKAGRAEDSFYGDDDDGPYCEACWDEKQRQDKEREDGDDGATG